MPTMKLSRIGVCRFLGVIVFSGLCLSRVVDASGNFQQLNHHVDSADSRQLEEGGRLCKTREYTEEENDKDQKQLAQYREETGGYAASRTTTKVIEVDVYFHVITKTDGTGSISDTMINHQMDVLNESFGGVAPEYKDCDGGSQSAGINTPFRFNLVKITRTKKNKWYNDGDNFYTEEIVKSLREGDCSDLNIFTQNMDYLGFASLPMDCEPEYDYVFLLPGSLPGGDANGFNEGDTATHEVGHWLGLRHTFYGGCDGDGDGVDDTPPEKIPAQGCPVNRDTCPGGGPDPVHNYMDYADDCCMDTFTQEQVDRMVDLSIMHRGFKVGPSTNSPEGAPKPSTPTRAPIGSTNSPIGSTNSPESTPNPSPPTRSPVGSPDNCNDGDTFALKKDKLQTCEWLKQKEKKPLNNICKKKTSYFETDGIVSYAPAHLVCLSTCKSCDKCYELKKAKFLYKIKKGGKFVTKSCKWLISTKGASQKDDLCARKEPNVGYPVAKEACPKTCEADGCS